MVLTEVMVEAGGATTTSTMTKIKRQITIAVEDTVKVNMDVVVKVEESNTITIRNLNIMHRTTEESQLDSRTLQKHRLKMIRHCY
jgi:pectate lyase